MGYVAEDTDRAASVRVTDADGFVASLGPVAEFSSVLDPASPVL
ncbi:hypothetical protein SAMN06265347_10592 [Halobellus salinus]|nr:hypothetical protein SAMN06265347_10592 [Halobellus salinus]